MVCLNNIKLCTFILSLKRLAYLPVSYIHKPYLRAIFSYILLALQSIPHTKLFYFSTYETIPEM